MLNSLKSVASTIPPRPLRVAVRFCLYRTSAIIYCIINYVLYATRRFSELAQVKIIKVELMLRTIAACG